MAGAYITLMNYYALYLGVTKKEHHSLGPLLGGVLCSLALLFSPLGALRPWAWLPLLVDPGCVFMVGGAIYDLIVTKVFKD